MKLEKLEDYVITIPDFPVPGIMFRDVTGILNDADGIEMAIDKICEQLEDIDFDVIMGPESRGFIFGMPVAYKMHKSFVPVRKPGKLPREVISREYALEYGTATIEIHKDSIKPGQKVVIIDDLAATGGTLKAVIELAEELGGEVVRIVTVMELAGLEPQKAVEGYDLRSIIRYEGK